MIYTYRRGDVIARGALYIILAVSVTIFFLFSSPGVWGLLFLAVLYTYALLAISPVFTHHSLTKDWLIVRHGALAKIEIPREKIRSYAPYEGEMRLRTGVYSPWRSMSAYLIAEPKNAVVVGLTEPIKLPSLLWKEVDTIVFDVEHRELFLKNLSCRPNKNKDD